MAQKSSDYLMSWFNTLGKMAKGVADFTGVAGLYHDLSTSMSNDDPWYVDSLNVAKDIAKIGTTPIRGVVKGVLAVGEKSYELGGVARQAVAKGILDTPLMYGRFKNEGESYDAYKMRVEANKEEIIEQGCACSAAATCRAAGPDIIAETSTRWYSVECNTSTFACSTASAARKRSGIRCSISTSAATTSAGYKYNINSWSTGSW
jgi:hypothetical protein